MSRFTSIFSTVNKDVQKRRRLLPYFRGRLFGVSILDRYIFAEIFQVFLVAVLVVTTLLMSVVIKEVAGELLGKQINLWKVIQYIGFLIIEKLSMTIPLASLFSGILAAGRLSGDSEITALRSAGISYPRIYSVFLFFGVLTSILIAYINLYYGPISSRAREDFEDWLKSYHSLTLVKPGHFLGGANMDGVSRKGQDIYARDREGDVLQDVQIREWYNGLDADNSEVVSFRDVSIPIGDGFLTQILHAREGELLNRVDDEGNEEKIIRLRNGYLIELDESRKHYQATNFLDGYMDYAIPPPVHPLGRLNVRPDNYTFFELFNFLDKLEKGGHQIDLCSINPQCKGSGSSKLGEVTDESQMFTLPAYSRMESMLGELRLWIIQNGKKVGKKGGPKKDEFQQKVRLSLQLTMFLGDAKKTRTRFEVEIHKRLAAPIANILFFFISFPLGLVVKRSGKGMGFVLALVVFFMYYGILTVGLSQAYGGGMTPPMGAYLPVILLTVFAIYIMAVRTEGFTPVKWLSYPFRRWLFPILEPLWLRVREKLPLDYLYDRYRLVADHPLVRSTVVRIVSLYNRTPLSRWFGQI